MKNNYVFIATIFRGRRIELGYSKRKLASLVGISDTELSRIEHGERENYNLLTLLKLCEVLRIDFIRLLVASGYLPMDCVDGGLKPLTDDITEEEGAEIPEPEKVDVVVTLEIL